MAKLRVCECGDPQGVHRLAESLAYGACTLCDCPGFAELPLTEKDERDTHYYHQRQPLRKLWSLCHDCALVKLDWLTQAYDPHVRRAAAHLILRHDVPGYDEFLASQGFERPVPQEDTIGTAQ